MSSPPEPLASSAPPPQGVCKPAFGRLRATVHLAHGLPFAVAAAIVPWQASSWFTIVTAALAALHVLVAVLCFARREARARLAARWVAYASLAFLVVVLWITAASAWYLVELYQDIGVALGAGLFAIGCAIALFTLPIALWSLCSAYERPSPASTLGAKHSSRRAPLALLLFGIVALSTLWAVASQARPRQLVLAPQVAEVERALASVFAAYSAGSGSVPLPEQGVPWQRGAPATCRDAVVRAELTLLVTLIDEQGEGSVGCVQAATAERLASRFAERLKAHAPRRVARAELVLVTAIHPLARTARLVDALKVRPALDGVCAAERCLAPWQLVALGAFTRFQPIPKVPDARFGSSLDEMAAVLAAGPEAPLVRFEAVSFGASSAGFTRLERLRSPSPPLTRSSVASAIAGAERYIVEHQGEQGFYAYALDPYSTELPTVELGNIARQAGAALVLCELGSTQAVASALRALRGLVTQVRQGNGYRALSLHETRAQLGHSALPLAAYLSCRRRSEAPADFRTETDALLGDLGRFLLRLQRKDGSFYNEVALPDGVPAGEEESLFGAGQAVLSLILLEEVARAEPGRVFPQADVLRTAIAKAMEHYAERHWPRALRSLFFLEENWHCLAARAALRAHRHDGYERFCLDYVAFKSRFILEPNEVEDPALIGGYGFGSMFPLHVTPAAGFGEALSAAIAVQRARGVATGDEEDLLAHVLRFVSGQQWDEPACFACATRGALGGFSESAATSSIRVDYVQHAMAALGHGAPLLGLR